MPVGLDFSDTVCIVVINYKWVDYAYEYTCLMECVSDGFIVCSCVLHNDPCFTGQRLDEVSKLSKIAVCVRHIIRRGYDNSEGLNDSHRALAFGNVDTYCVHKHLSYWLELVIDKLHTLLVTYSAY